MKSSTFISWTSATVHTTRRSVDIAHRITQMCARSHSPNGGVGQPDSRARAAADDADRGEPHGLVAHVPRVDRVERAAERAFDGYCGQGPDLPQQIDPQRSMPVGPA